jgi:hypothetical protein
MPLGAELAFSGLDRRSVPGGRPNSCWNVSLTRHTLPKPGASATSPIGRKISWIDCLASRTRRVWAAETGEAPRCWRNRRRSCRSPIPSREASASTSPEAIAPPYIRANAHETVFDVPCQASRSGDEPGSTARTRPVASFLTYRRTRMEGHLLRQRRPRRTYGATADSDGLEHPEDAPVLPRITSQKGAAAGFEIHDHVGSMNARSNEV